MHEGHRQRMRDKFLKGGVSAFLPHEFLEMLLFYAIPRCNTNEIAHELIDRFGSFRGVLDASLEELKSVKGIGENAAIFLKILSSANSFYFQEEQDKVERFDSLSAARDFGISRFVGATNEDIYALLLDNQLRKIDCIHLNKGTVNHVAFDLAELYLNCLTRGVSAVILYHNHPRGLAVPSQEDLEVTYQLQGKLSDINVCLLEHFVVSDFSCMPILRSGNRTAPRGGIERSALDHFYGN